MVTTVQSHLDTNFDCFNIIEACLPPGSMTGAPKQRSIELLKSIENSGIIKNVNK